MKKIRGILLAAVWITAMAVMGCQKDDSHSEQSVKAILESFLSCSVQDVQEYQNTYLGLTAEAVGDQTGESGIASVGGLEQYFKDKYGEIMTDECIESMIDNRTIIQCMQLAEKYNSDIVSKDISPKRQVQQIHTHMRQQWHPLPIRIMRHLSRERLR